MKTWRAIAGLVLAGTLAGGVAVAAEDSRVIAGRAVLKQHQDSIVWVSATLKSQMTGMGVQFGHGKEQKVEALGAIIDPSGLTVVSASMMNPMDMMMSFMMMGEQRKIESKSQFSDVKMRLADGTELAAKLILQDPDLDLAFILPEKPKEGALPKFTSVTLKARAKPKALDDIIVLARLGKSLDRQPTVILTRISSIITKPRTFYTGSGIQTLGAPAFTLDGSVLGIVLMRKAPRSGGGLGSLMTQVMGGGMAPVIVPAEDVMEIAKQALERKSAGRKPAARR